MCLGTCVLGAILFPLSGEGEGADPQALGMARRGASLGIQTPVQEGVVGRLGSQASPVVATTSVSPSVTLRLYLEESSPGSAVMATLLTKSSFRGGGWLTQKLRGLGGGCEF